MKKRIFISHSSKDFDAAMRLCSALEERNMMCWIAPRDIPYGNVWMREITEGIEEAELIICLISKHSVLSSQVVRELALALQNEKKVVPVRLDDSKIKGALAYYLSDRQHVWIGEDEAVDFAKLVNYAECYLNGEVSGEAYVDRESEPKKSRPVEERYSIDFDAELNATFDRLFGPDRKETEEVDPFRKKLLDRIARNYMKRQMGTNEEPDETEPVEFLAPANEEELHTRWFDLTDKDGMTLAFLVKRALDPNTLYVSFKAEEMSYEDEEGEDGSICRTFEAAGLDYDGNPIVVITFLKNQSMALLNMGFISPSNNTFKLSKEPKSMEFQKILDGASEEASYVYCKASECASKIIIDPSTGKIVHREKRYDSENQEWVMGIRLHPKRRYFAFELKNDDSSEPTPQYEMAGKGFFYGKYDLSVNMLRAAECFEKAGTPEAWYYLGRIFMEDELLQDEDDAREYLRMAADAGEERAKKLLETL